MLTILSPTLFRPWTARVNAPGARESNSESVLRLQTPVAPVRVTMLFNLGNPGNYGTLDYARSVVASSTKSSTIMSGWYTESSVGSP